MSSPFCVLYKMYKPIYITLSDKYNYNNPIIQERIKVQQEINNFRLHYQHPETRREFDLNDPNLIKKQLPARLNDDDPRCGPSSAQKYVCMYFYYTQKTTKTLMWEAKSIASTL